MKCERYLFVDAGIEKLHIRYISEDDQSQQDRIHVHHGQLTHFLIPEKKILQGNSDNLASNLEVYLTGKLSLQAQKFLKCGKRLHPESVLFHTARFLAMSPGDGLPSVKSIAIIDVSASGFCIAVAQNNGRLKPQHLEKNPSCGAGSGINLERILGKLNIAVEDVDSVLQEYLGEQGQTLRSSLPLRMERCGVFSVSATVSDKNQGIPIQHALAVTMKSEVAKAISRVPSGVDRVYLTGGVFRWQFMRDCAEDFFRAQGIETIVYDENQSLLFLGMKAISKNVSGKADHVRRLAGLHTKQTQRISLPSFRELKDRLSGLGRYVNRQNENDILSENTFSPEQPVNIALDIGSSMAKMIIADAFNGKTIYRQCIANRGDALQTVRHLLEIVEASGSRGMSVQNWGLTGSGRYQIQRILQAVYPHLREHIFTMVENEAHVLGSLDLLREHIAGLKQQGYSSINDDVGILVDIGGEDTKISIIDLKRKTMRENAMNCKCSAGTGSLMDILSDMMDISNVATAYRMAFVAERAWRINATCAVFLMEEARQMQSAGMDISEILASCCHAIVENMARTLWPQVNILPNTALLLHGQTMLSDPLPLATINRLETHCRGPMFGVIPPHPGYRACLGLLNHMPTRQDLIDKTCNWENMTRWSYQRKLFSCSGKVCGNELMRCTRATISSPSDQLRIHLNIGGCTSVNDREASNWTGDNNVPDAYREIWQWIKNRHSQTENADRLVIPRCFSLSQQAYLFAKCFEHAGIAVHTDSVLAEDVRAGRKYFDLDTCAPNMGTTGQLTRLAGAPHGLIFLPQIDFLPTEGGSLGRTCTTNQGGIWAAVQFARLVHPHARFMVKSVNLGEGDLNALTRQFHRSLKDVFAFFGVSMSLPRFREIWRESLNDRKDLEKSMADLAADYLETAVEADIPVTIVCGREYVLNPGIYDQHISKLLRDKGIMPIPSYVLDAALDDDFNHIYWKTAHEIISKVKAIANGTLHEKIHHSRLQAAIRRLEKESAGRKLTHAVVTTFRCGPDSVTAPLLQEIAKSVPSLWIQSDGTIAELAHLENRISTHLRRLQQKWDDDKNYSQRLQMEILTQFNLDTLNSETDVIYFPTLSDNRIMTSLSRTLGLVAIDNYAEENFDLEQKGRKGRQYVGNDVCLPLAAVFADMLSAVEDFMERRAADDPLLRGKNRLVLFMNGGDGPCRLGQYLHVFKLAFLRIYGSPTVLPSGDPNNAEFFHIRLLESLSSSVPGKRDYSSVLEPWAGILAYQATVVHGLCHSLLLQATTNCQDEKTFEAMTADYRRLQDTIRYQIEHKAPPGKISRQMVDIICRQYPALSGPAKYIGYRIWNNFGLRKILRDFSKKWILPGLKRWREDKSLLRIHLDGEIYMRTSQSVEILKIILQYLGSGSFTMTVTPTWSFFEAVLYTRVLAAREKIADLDQGDNNFSVADEKKRQQTIINDSLKTIENLRNILARPLYNAAGVSMPHSMHDVYAAAAPVIPTAKPYGELVPFVGEAILRCRENVDLILNLSPEGCMVSGMGDMLIPSIISQAGETNQTAIVSIFSRDGEVQEDQIRLALVKATSSCWDSVMPGNST